MEDINKLLHLSETFPVELEHLTEDYLIKLRVLLWGQTALATHNKEKVKDLAVASPQQTKKRAKRLSLLNEDKEVEVDNVENVKRSPDKSKYANVELFNSDDCINDVNKPIETEVPVAAPRTNCGGIAGNEKTSKPEMFKKSEAAYLMPPPPAPAVAPTDDTLNKRPQRAAKLKSEKNLKEPKLNAKLRRPTDEVKIKLEHEQRPSQMYDATLNLTISKRANDADAGKDSLLSQKSDDSVSIIPQKRPSVVSINSDIEDFQTANKETVNEQKKNQNSSDSGIREMRIKIKREKSSLDNKENVSGAPSAETVFKVPEALPLPISLPKTEDIAIEKSLMGNSLLSSTINTTNVAPTKKMRKKKDIVHKPIKVERFSDLDSKPSPISSRTRHGSLNKSDNETSATKEINRPASIYEDAVEAAPSRSSKEIIDNASANGVIINEIVNFGQSADATINLGPISETTFSTNAAQTTYQVAPGQTTFVVDSNPNATVTINKHSGAGSLVDTTFDVNQISKTGKIKQDDAGGHRSFETAKDSSMPNDDSLLTEEEEENQIEAKPKAPSASVKTKESTKTFMSGKPAAGNKMQKRAHELFNPLAQSPVKLRVEAFENVAAAAATEQSKRPLRSRKENATPTSVTTPVIGKLQAPALGRFLTPTQSSNITTVNSALARKGTTSASKAVSMIKSATASTLYRSNSAVSSKTLQRESSTDDFRKGLHNLAEERKKQREQKHLLAAQQREAKERERAERMAKLAKEREEKRLLKKRELEEIQRKLRQQQEEEAARLKAAKEREMLLQMKHQQQLSKQKMLPPPPKAATKYTFEMLHEDDSTDDEDKVSYKRPPPPSWSRSHVRGPNMLKQEYTPSAFIDSFFSVQPMTPDLKIIFPNIDARHLKRNSSVLWSTPPRYSELPKY